jgi:hypothetical protein
MPCISGFIRRTWGHPTGSTAQSNAKKEEGEERVSSVNELFLQLQSTSIYQYTLGHHGVVLK